ncbi:MAG: DUF3365 domain-containing protein [Proteobacteria bacterium]|nr:DUF3365 domain-containing protein [Pseudomonadota bacterium]MBU1738101.1 DUF3365 domain-containing protein [Pseudomonadota bacterium]
MAVAKLHKALGIRAKFVIMMAILGLLALSGIGYFAYVYSMQNSLKDADTKARIIDAYVKASRAYFMAVQRPLIVELVERDRFYPELQSGFGITRRTIDMINAKELKGFEFRQASLLPHHPPNKADLFEESVINKFKSDINLQEQTGKTTRKGELFYFKARPIKMDAENCLKCHKNPATAPKDMIEMYGEAGFDNNFKLGDIFGAYIVYVPMAPAVAAAKLQALILFAGGAGTMLLGLIAIWLFLDARIVKPIMELCNRTEEVSVGRNLDKSLLTSKMKDEVATLARSIDRLRISLVKMLKRK